MAIVLGLRNRAALDDLIAAQQDPSSPQYHHWLTPVEFNARFGPTPAQAAAVSSWLASHGFKIEDASPGRRVISFRGSAAAAESTFKVAIHTDDSGELYTNLADPVVPKSLGPIVASVRGLSNLVHAHRNVRIARNSLVAPSAIVGAQTAFGPNDLYTFYDQTPPTNASNNGSGTDCIAVIEDSDFDDPSISAFDAEFGIGTINLTRVYPDLTPPGANGDSIEALLDVEYAHAAAPGTAIYAYIGNDSRSTTGSGLVDAAIDAVDGHVAGNACGSISLSFSFCGVPKTFYQTEIDPIAKQAAAQGQALFVSAGDQGAAGLTLNKKKRACTTARSRNVNEVSADPYITSVGGTQFTPVYSGGADSGSVSESVWHDKYGSTGGGKSKVFAVPSYQAGIRGLGRKRAVPDISFAASPLRPGFFLGYQGSVQCCIGGTSLGAPYWAGIAQLIAQRAGQTRFGRLNPTLYSLPNGGASGIRDVTVGKNSFHGVSGFKAVRGYDRSTGLGTPDIDQLLTAIGGP